MKMPGKLLSFARLCSRCPAHAQTPLGSLTPAQQAINWAQTAIHEHSDRNQPYNDLAVAYIRRTRETSDSSYLEQARAAVEKSLQVSPDNF